MRDINAFAVLVAAIVVLLLGSAYYAVFAAAWAHLSGAGARESRPKPRKLGLELLRALILASVVAGLASHARISDAGGGLLLGAALWIGFPFVLWTGAIMWENTPWRLAALHAADWLVKLLVVAVIVSVWQ
jgi:Protein of unknown function (DUF1761)